MYKYIKQGATTTTCEHYGFPTWVASSVSSGFGSKREVLSCCGAAWMMKRDIGSGRSFLKRSFKNKKSGSHPVSLLYPESFCLCVWIVFSA